MRRDEGVNMKDNEMSRRDGLCVEGFVWCNAEKRRRLIIRDVKVAQGGEEGLCSVCGGWWGMRKVWVGVVAVAVVCASAVYTGAGGAGVRST